VSEQRESYQIVPATGEVVDLVPDVTPDATLASAQRAAKALQEVVSKKTKPVKFNGEQYLEFEDWQTVGRFYNVTAEIEWSRFVEFGDAKGFEARAIARNTVSGQVVSAAEAMCLGDEPNWKAKPLFQLRSMAQTRACAKALRNVLAWVVVLAGYRPTPAEEIADMARAQQQQAAPPIVAKITPGNGSTTTAAAPPGKKTEATAEQKAVWKMAANIPDFQKLDDEGKPVTNSLGYHTINFEELGKFFKNSNLPGSVKDMDVFQLAAATALLRDYPKDEQE
jgi:hypothetical protein